MADAEEYGYRFGRAGKGRGVHAMVRASRPEDVPAVPVVVRPWPTGGLPEALKDMDMTDPYTGRIEDGSKEARDA